MMLTYWCLRCAWTAVLLLANLHTRARPWPLVSPLLVQLFFLRCPSIYPAAAAAALSSSRTSTHSRNSGNLSPVEASTTAVPDNKMQRDARARSRICHVPILPVAVVIMVLSSSFNRSGSGGGGVVVVVLVVVVVVAGTKNRSSRACVCVVSRRVMVMLGLLDGGLCLCGPR